jgi:hypothetical protein
VNFALPPKNGQKLFSSLKLKKKGGMKDEKE